MIIKMAQNAKEISTPVVFVHTKFCLECLFCSCLFAYFSGTRFEAIRSGTVATVPDIGKNNTEA